MEDKDDSALTVSIYSIEHQAWWAPNRHGYTPWYPAAGLYSYKEACKIVKDANQYLKPGIVHEVIVRRDEIWNKEYKWIHPTSHPMAGKTVRIIETAKHPQVPGFGGSKFEVYDWWDRGNNSPWVHCMDNPACLIYALRSVDNRLPQDDEVVYGHIGAFGHIVHISEIEPEKEGPEK